MKYTLLGCALLSSALFAEDETFQTRHLLSQLTEFQEHLTQIEQKYEAYTSLEKTQKEIEGRLNIVSKAQKDQMDQMKKDVSTIDSVKGDLQSMKQEISALKEQNKLLQNLLQDREKRELYFASVLEKVQSTLEKYDQQEVHQKSRFTAFNARLDNFSAQIDEVQKKLKR